MRFQANILQKKLLGIMRRSPITIHGSGAIALKLFGSESAVIASPVVKL